MILMRLEVDACGSMSVEKSDYPPPTLTRDEMEAINKMEWSCSREELARLPIFTDLEEAMLDNVRAKIKSDKEAEYAGIKRSVSYMEFDVREHGHDLVSLKCQLASALQRTTISSVSTWTRSRPLFSDWRLTTSWIYSGKLVLAATPALGKLRGNGMGSVLEKEFETLGALFLGRRQ